MKKKTEYRSNVIFFVPALRTILFIVSGLVLLIIPPFRGSSLIDVSKWWPLLCILINIITIVILFLLVRQEGRSFKELINHNSPGKNTLKEILIVIPIMLVLGIGGLLGFSWLVYGQIPLTTIQPLPIWAAILVLVLLPLTIIFSEIPLYLGYCAPRIKKKCNNEFFAIAYPLFFFALQHSFMPLLFDFKHMLSRFLMFIPLLIMMGIWYYRKKDLLPLMVGHGVLDILTGAQLLILSLNPAIFDTMTY